MARFFKGGKNTAYESIQSEEEGSNAQLNKAIRKGKEKKVEEETEEVEREGKEPEQYGSHYYNEEEEEEDDDDDTMPSLSIKMKDMRKKQTGNKKGENVRGEKLSRKSSNDAVNYFPKPGPEEEREMDTFLRDVYDFYIGQGFWTKILRHIVDLMIVPYVVIFSTFLIGCADYQELFATLDLSQSVSLKRLKNMPWYLIVCFVFSALFWLWQVVYLFSLIKKLSKMRRFYTKVLQINEDDLATAEWNEIVKRLIEVHNERGIYDYTLNQFDIANRILRKENYIIALLNKEILELNLKISKKVKTKQLLTRSLEWNLSFCLFGFFFDDHYRLKRRILQKENREQLGRELRNRFIFWGIVNLVLSPFIMIFLFMFFLFRYGEEFHKNPGSLGARQYTALAKVLFREFNEYPHTFQNRLRESIPKANEYVEQFPNEKLAILARLIAFVSGSLAFILALLSIIDEELLFNLQITPGRSVLFYLGLFSAIFAMAKSLIPEENRPFQAQRLMTEIAEYTHYLPDHWKKQLHSNMVHREFVRFYEYKLIIFAMELLSAIFVPFLLAFTLSSYSLDIVDFFRNFSVEKDHHLGHICGFAAFDFSNFGDSMYGAPVNNGEERLHSKGGKMEKSFLFFKANNPDWQPDEKGKEFLTSIHNFQLKQRSKQAESEDVNASLDNEKLKGLNLLNSALLVSSTTSSVGANSSMLNNGNPNANNSVGIISMLDQIYQSNIGNIVGQ